MEYVATERKGWAAHPKLKIWQEDINSEYVDPNFFDEDYNMAVSTAKSKVWDGSIYLADCLCEDLSIPLHPLILELGCGVGYIGLLLAQKGHNVLLTDVALVVEDLVERNIDANANVGGAIIESATWQDAQQVGDGSAAISALNWKNDVQEHLGEHNWAMLKTEKVTIVASECVWLTALVKPFVNTLRTLLASAGEGSEALVTFVERTDSGEGAFLTLAMFEACLADHGCSSEVLKRHSNLQLTRVTLN